METKNYGRGVLMCLIATISWGGMFPVMTSALTFVDPFTFTCIRYALAGLAFVVVLKIMDKTTHRYTAKELLLCWFFGTCGFAGFQFLVFEGQRLAGPEGALTASIMMATMPLQAFLFNWIVRKVVPAPFVLGFILLSFAGIVLVATKGDFTGLVNNPSGYGPQLLIILGALCWVIYTAGASFLPALSPVRYTTITTGLGLISAVIITGGMIAGGAIAAPTLEAYSHVIPHMIYMSTAAGFVGVLAWNIGNKMLTPLNGTLFMDVVPTTAFIISALSGVIPHPIQIIGALLTISAVIGNNLCIRRNMMKKNLQDQKKEEPSAEPVAVVTPAASRI